MILVVSGWAERGNCARQMTREVKMNLMVFIGNGFEHQYNTKNWPLQAVFLLTCTLQQTTPMLRKTDFVHSANQEPHRLRTRQILRQHPDVRKLIGKNAYTVIAIFGLVSFQVVLSWLVRDSSWWIVVGAAYLLGAFADHALFVMIHECAHHLF